MGYRPYAIVQAPSVLGLTPSGVQDLPKALLDCRFAERIGARVGRRLETPPYDDRIDPQTRTLNAQAIADWSPKLADAMEEVLDQGKFPVILGGDCSILLGTTLALKRRGRFGLLFIDGHADFYQPEATNGEAASMDLAFATGRGPAVLADLEGRGPLVRDEDIVVFSYRDAEQQAEYGSQALAENITAYDIDAVHELGASRAAEAAIKRLTRSDVEGFFIHIDADCLGDDVMPAVDYRLSDGLTLQELTDTLAMALQSEKAVGLEITIYNPRLDTDGRAGRSFVDALVAAMVR